MADLGDSFTVGGGEDFFASLAKDMEVEGFNFPTEAELESTESAATPPVVPAPEGVAPEVTAGSSATPPAGGAPETAAPPEGYVTKEMYDNLYALMGKQTQELGELRAALQPVEEEEETVSFTPAPVTDEVEGQIIEAIERHGGQAIAAWAAGNAPHLYESVLDLWADSGERGAARKAAQFDLRFQAELARSGEAQEEQERQRFLAEVAPQMDELTTQLAPTYGLTPGTTEVDNLLAETLENADDAIKALIVSRDENERTAGLRAVLAQAAVTQAIGGGTLAAPPAADPAAEAALAAARAEAIAKAKGAATLGTGGLQLENVVVPETQEQDLAQRIEQLQTAPKATSVAQGLSGGGIAAPAA